VLRAAAVASRQAAAPATLERPNTELGTELVHELQLGIGSLTNLTSLIGIVEGIVNNATEQIDAALHTYIPSSIDASNLNLTFSNTGSPSCIIRNPIGSRNCICETSASSEATITRIEGLDTFTLVPDATLSLETGNAITWPWNLSVTVESDAGASVRACGLSVSTPPGTVAQPLDLTGHAVLNVTVSLDGLRVGCIRVGALSVTFEHVTFHDPLVEVRIVGIPVSLTGLFQSLHWQDVTRQFQQPLQEALTNATAALAPQLIETINQQIANATNFSSCSSRVRAAEIEVGGVALPER